MLCKKCLAISVEVAGKKCSARGVGNVAARRRWPQDDQQMATIWSTRNALQEAMANLLDPPTLIKHVRAITYIMKLLFL